MTPPEYNDVDQRAVEQLKNTGIAPPWEKEFIRKDGRRVAVLIGVVTLATDQGDIEAVSVVVDISERKLLEQQLRQAQKMEAIGQLAGGVAHDFNNLLSVIIGYSDILLDRAGQDTKMRTQCQEINKAGNRAASLTRQLLAFSRQQVLEPRVLNLNTVVVEIEKMLRRLIGEDIEFRTALDPTLGSVKADPGQIEQIIMNLAVNARDAMPEGGKLVIETSNAELDDRYALQHPPFSPGRYVLLAVTDTGIGMSEETKTPHFRAIFYDQRSGQRHWSWAFDRLRSREAEWRLHLGLQRTRTRVCLQDLSATGRSVCSAESAERVGTRALSWDGNRFASGRRGISPDIDSESARGGGIYGNRGQQWCAGP